MKTLLSESFFEKGAFLADPLTGEVLLGLGGKVFETNDPPEGEAFYLKDFYTNDFLVYQPDEWISVSREELLAAINEFSTREEVYEEVNYDHLYEEDFKKLMNSFGERLQKAVLVSRTEFKVPSPLETRMRLFRRSLEFGAGMPYGLWSNNRGMIGSTPETLFSITGKGLRTEALAGTAPRGQERALMESTKDRDEHDLVVKDITEKLSPFLKALEVSSTGLSPYKDMVHLRTDISGDLKDEARPTHLACALSPTAALGGYPSAEALEFLKQSHYARRFPRRFFGSAFGVTTKERCQFVVSIRNIQWENDLFIIESGGGVLQESLLEKELAEVRLKRETIRKHYL